MHSGDGKYNFIQRIPQELNIKIGDVIKVEEEIYEVQPIKIPGSCYTVIRLVPEDHFSSGTKSLDFLLNKTFVVITKC